MAVFNLELFSKSLMCMTQVTVLMPSLTPQDDPAEFYGSHRKYKVLWLLHGSNSNNNDWIKYTNIVPCA